MMLDPISIFILLVCFVAIGVEIVHFRSYKKDLELPEQAIGILKKGKDEYTIEGNNDIANWLSAHLDIERNDKTIIFKKDNHSGLFVLLSYPSILGRGVPRSRVHFVPSILTALGILGTFWGISTGVAGIDLENLTDGKLLTVTRELLGGMKTAFYTSLFGLGTSIVLTFILVSLAWWNNKKRKSLRKDLNDIAVLATSERLLSKFDNKPTAEAANQLKKVVDNLNGLSTLNADAIGDAVAQAIAERLKETLTNLSTLNANAIGGAVAQAINAENSPLISSLKHLEDIQANQSSQLASLLEQKITQPVVEQLTAIGETITQGNSELLKEVAAIKAIQINQGETVRCLLEDAAGAVTTLNQELGNIAPSLAGAVTTIQEFQQQTLTELQQFANSLDTTLTNFQRETKGVLTQVGTEINQALDASIEGMTAQRAAFKESATQASDTFRGIRTDLESALTTQAEQQRGMLDAITTQTREILQEANSAFQNQSNTLQTVGAEAANLMNTARENLSSTLNNIDTTLQNTRQTVQEELENFRIEYQTSLTTFFKLQNNLLNETLGRQREGLAEVVASLQQTFEYEANKRQEMSQQVDTSMERILQTTKTVNNLANSLGMTSSERLGQLQELSKTIGGEAQRVEDAYKNMKQQLEKALEKGNEELSEYLENANKFYSDYFKNFDSATAKVCDELNNTSEKMLQAAQYFVAVADRQDVRENN